MTLQPSKRIKSQKECIFGGPITAVCWIPCYDDAYTKNGASNVDVDGYDCSTSPYSYDVLYGQGPYIHFVPYFHIFGRAISTECSSKQDATPGRQKCHVTTMEILSSPSPIVDVDEDNIIQKLLVFPNGGTIHGIRQVQLQQKEVTHEINHRTILLFGQRQVCFIQIQASQKNMMAKQIAHDTATDFDNNVDKTNNIQLQILPIHMQFQKEEQKTLDCLTVHDWIWDSQFVNVPSHHYPQTLIIGLAHNSLEIYQYYIHYDTMTVSTAVQLIHIQSIQHPSIKCMLYCMTILVPSPSVMDPSLQTNENTSTGYKEAAQCYDTPIVDTITIASGTVTNEICLWSIEISQTVHHVIDLIPSMTSHNNLQYQLQQQPIRSCRVTSVQSALTGHEGAIMAIKFHTTGQYMISTSDDRTIRLWEKQNHLVLSSHPQNNSRSKKDFDDCNPVNQEKTWILKWTAYGHTARGWDVAFCHIPKQTSSTTSCINSLLDHTVVLSTGEDGTLRVWDGATGSGLATLRGHACQCVWRVDTIPDILPNNNTNSFMGITMSGGNDGTVAFYSICDVIPSIWYEENHVQSNDTRIGSWQSTFLVPDDRINQKNSLNQVVPSANKKKTKSEYNQIIVGIDFLGHPTQIHQNYDDNKLSNNTFSQKIYPDVIVATRMGSVWSLNVKSGIWTSLEPWNRCNRMNHDGCIAIESENFERTIMTTAFDGCCMCVHPILPLLSIGTMSGDIILSQLNTFAAAGNNSIQLSAKKYRSAQKLEWIQKNILISYHVHSVVLWAFPNLLRNYSNDDAHCDLSNWYTDVQKYRIISCKTCVKGLGICAALERERYRLAIGDTRGNISLFDVQCILNEQNSNCDITPISYLRECHKKEHVNDIHWKDSKTIISVGNDGCMLFCSNTQNNELVKLLSIPVGSYSGVTKIYNVSDSSIIVGGYYGNTFAIVDAKKGYEFLAVDTGGRQRSIDVWMSQNKKSTKQNLFGKSCAVVTCKNRSDGLNDIQVQGRTSTCTEQSQLTHHSIGTTMHGESIFDIHLFLICAAAGMVGIVTGSEDCSAKVSVYWDGKVVSSALLPPQVSCVRAVHSCRYNACSSLVVVGDKYAVNLFLIHDINPQAKILDVDVQYVGTGNPIEKSLIDQRINCVRVVTLKGKNGNILAVVVSGDSNGSCYMYCFSETFKSSGRLLYQDERPILCLEILQLDTGFYIFIGGTAGDVSIVFIPTSSFTASSLEDPLLPLLTYNAHSMGTNSISVKLEDTFPDGEFIVRVGTCGDDQAITYSEIHFRPNEAGEFITATVMKCVTNKECAVSALKGIEFLDDRHLIASGYDQRLTIWQYHNQLLMKIDDTPIDVGDINCVSYCRISEGISVVAVGGAGVEILSIGAA